MADLGGARARAEEQPEQHKGGDDGSGVAASGHGHRELADGEADTYEHVIDRAQALRHGSNEGMGVTRTTLSLLNPLDVSAARTLERGSLQSPSEEP